jgi:NhaP-type Na+/H+ or K+/H+ antiporter
MNLFRTFLFYLIFLTHCVAQAAELANVFTHITSTLNGTVFYYLGVTVDWSIDTNTAQIGDTFSLQMPYVHGLYASPSIQLSNGVTVASCQLNPGGSLRTSSSINCTIVIDPKLYTSLSGTYSIQYDLMGGGRPANVDIAARWVVGTNTLTWNNLTFNVNLATSAVVTQQQGWVRWTTISNSQYQLFNYSLYEHW